MTEISDVETKGVIRRVISFVGGTVREFAHFEDVAPDEGFPFVQFVLRERVVDKSVSKGCDQLNVGRFDNFVVGEGEGSKISEKRFDGDGEEMEHLGALLLGAMIRCEHFLKPCAQLTQISGCA